MSEDCVQLFGSRGSRLIHLKHATSIYPLQLSIQNNNEHAITIDRDDISLRLTNYDKVARRMQNTTMLNIVKTIAGSAFIATLAATGGLIALGAGALTASAPLAIFGAATCASVPFMVLISTPMSTTVNGVQSLRTNSSIKKDVKHKSLARGITIDPGNTTDMLIFVTGKDYRQRFCINIHVQDEYNSTTHFDINMKKRSSSKQFNNR